MYYFCRTIYSDNSQNNNRMKKNIISNILKNDFTTLLLRVALAYLCLALLRVVFYLFNASILGAIAFDEVADLARGSFTFDTANICYTLSLFILLSLLPFRFRANRIYQLILAWVFGLTMAAYVFFNCSDTVYFHYALKRATIDEFQYADNGNTTLIMLRSAAENWHMVLLGVVLWLAIMWIYRQIKYHPTTIKSNAAYYSTGIAILAISVALMIVGMRGGIGRDTRPITLSNAAQYAATPQKASIVLSNPFCILRTIGNKRLHYQRYFGQSELDSIYSPHHNPSPTDSTAFVSQKGKNVVVLILESFSYEHSAYLNPSLYPNEQSITPFLDSLMQQGYLFRRAYSNGRKSIDALPSVLASIPSFKTPFALMPQALSPMDGIAKLLGEEGYSTWFFNGSIESSMGFVAYAKLAGTKNIRTRENYEASHGTADYDGYWGIWDEPFLQYMAHELSQAPQPFFASAFTLSSHHPFVVPNRYKDLLPEGHTKIHKPVAYTDLALRNFFATAKEQPWFDNTIFVIVADHVSSEVYSQVTRTPTGNFHIMYMLYTQDGSLRGESSQVTQQIDIMPTLLGLMRYEKPYFSFGRDLFSSDSTASRPFAINYSGSAFQWITDSVSLFFDETSIVNAYRHSDSLQKYDISGALSDVEKMEQKRIEAFIQSYYQSVENRDFSSESNHKEVK